MPKFMFIYHGGGTPATPEEGAKAMAAWTSWLDGIGGNLVDGGNPAGMSKTVTASGVDDNGGANPVSGYSLVNAPDIDAACKMAKGCPILDGGNGSIEVAEALEM
ncbi:hypothetical protein U5922_011180 [Aquicoccus sp. G2-2]|uniref:hypothetical protein n=1 Tax=Aquicoccus sp. G2-2 TaxID=3092120 RepID=UPI002ADF4889|nr:hypothetical protein [Aquicoccus sp. G2-2]MEA1113997.1 hypothetical protein [Aquicoccus sp. G2-2]